MVPFGAVGRECPRCFGMGRSTLQNGPVHGPTQHGPTRDPEWTDSGSRVDRVTIQNGPIQDAEWTDSGCRVRCICFECKNLCRRAGASVRGSPLVVSLSMFESSPFLGVILDVLESSWGCLGSLGSFWGCFDRRGALLGRLGGLFWATLGSLRPDVWPILVPRWAQVRPQNRSENGRKQHENK